MPDPIEIGFTAAHPTAAGHFPGNPIIPGATLLDEVVRALTKISGTNDVAITIRSTKFFHPLRPGETMRVQFQSGDADTTIGAAETVKFECRRTTDDILLTSGIIDSGPPPP